MADWQHKERNWNADRYAGLNGDTMYNRNSPKGKPCEPRSFTEWLDWQCTDGWEVIKISRDFSNSVAFNDTWCVFRRKSRV